MIGEDVADPGLLGAGEHGAAMEAERAGLDQQFEPSAQTIRSWLAQADLDAGQRTDGLTTDEREELRRLWRENKTSPGMPRTTGPRQLRATRAAGSLFSPRV
jgi:transposase-like protein